MRHAWIFFWLAFVSASPVWADSSPQEVFVAARDAYKSADEPALVASSARLQAENYSLAPYVEYWRMLLRLEQADKAEVQAFLERYDDLPFSERIRTEWLKKLGKRRDWNTFFDALPRLPAEDASVTCYAVLGRALQGDDAALQQGRPLWLSAEQPAACDELFAQMADRGVLTQEDLWARFRLVLQQGKVSTARSVLKYLDKSDSASLKLLDKVYENPQRTLEKKTVSSKSRFGRELNLHALERVWRAQPDLALELWQKMKSAYGEADQRYLWGRMALYAARRHDATALDWFANAADAPLSEEQMAWRARAALRVKRWDALQDSIAAMPASMQEDPIWRYWKARLLKEKGQIGAANAILVPLARERSFYGVLAEEELGDAMSAPPSSYKASDDEVRAMRNSPGVQRALELRGLDMNWEARSEWAWARRSMDDKQLIAAAEVAFREGWYDVAINTADKTTLTHDFDLRYPTPYREMMEARAKENDLDEAWVYGLIRQESRFISSARSAVGAAGLMQVMPATAKWIARRIGMSDYSHGMVNQLDTNIQFGTHYLRYTMDQFNGQPVMATAAYNAGPGRARRWAPAEAMEGAIYAETIPFTETRDYVKKVMSNAYFYSHRLGTRLQTLKQRLGLVVAGG
ncbi:MAG TPA: transglycosylase SLT domain-containing protein, partial [Methylophilaceae bacterium]|nr:transglycosylase SLT domain-containing protein [Methylophilaceae bacterium]